MRHSGCIGYTLLAAALALTTAFAKHLHADGEAREAGVIAITLVDSGDEPRHSLRYAPQPGQTLEVELNILKTIKSESSDPSVPDKPLPAAILRFDVSATAPGASGRVSVRCVLRDVDIIDHLDRAPAEAEMYRAQLKALRGLRITLDSDIQGRIRQVDFDLPSVIDGTTVMEVQQIAKYLAMMIVPLPDEPVGPGASWRATSAIDYGGRSITSTVIAGLESAEDDRLTLKLTTREQAEPHEFEIPQRGPEMRGELVKYDSSGRGSAKVDLTQALAASLALESEVQVELRLRSDGQTRTVTGTTSIALHGQAEARGGADDE